MVVFSPFLIILPLFKPLMPLLWTGVLFCESATREENLPSLIASHISQFLASGFSSLLSDGLSTAVLFLPPFTGVFFFFKSALDLKIF